MTTCPRLDELPPPPPGKEGWPWTVESQRITSSGTGDGAWPRVSVVVAALNQVAYVEEMLRSILLQGYPDLELIVLDGGSTDGTLDILGRYRPWIAHFVSEPDTGQSNAVNKGLSRMTGSLFSIFDTDDVMLPGALGVAASVHRTHPDRIVVGDVLRLNEATGQADRFRPPPLDLRAYVQWWIVDFHGGPGMFFPTVHLAQVGLLDESLHFFMDYEYVCRFLQVTSFSPVGAPVAIMRLHQATKSARQVEGFHWDLARITTRNAGLFPELAREGDRQIAGPLIGSGIHRLLRGDAGGFRFIREALRRAPVTALTWVFPGLLLRRAQRVLGSLRRSHR